MTNFSSTSLKITILYLDTTLVVTRISLLSPRQYQVIPVRLKNLGANKLGQRVDPKEDHHLKFWQQNVSSVTASNNNLKVVTSLDPSAEIKIRMAARELHDEDLSLKIGSYVHGSRSDFTALEVKYHKACYQTYLNKVR